MRTRNGFLTIESRRLPLIDVTYHRTNVQGHLLDDYREAFEEYARLASQGAPVAYLLDMREFDPLQIDAKSRQQAALIFHDYAGRLRPTSVAEARVITSAITRGVVTAFDWLTNANKWPCRQFATPPEAEAWLRSLLREREEQGKKAANPGGGQPTP